MKAITYQSLGEIELSELSDPQPNQNEVVVKVRASGICHTDIDILYGRYGSSTFPIVPGHEYAGEIVAVGEGHGGFAEFSVVHQDNIFPISDMPYEIAALAEPVGCVLNGLDAIDTKACENALIFGAGPIGMLMALSLRTRGVNDVTMTDIDESRLELAESFGLKTYPATPGDLTTLEKSVDLVADATGVPKVAENLINYAANGGNVLFFGVCPPGETISVSPHDVFRRQIRIAGTHSLNHNIPEAIAAIDAIGPEIERLISHRVALGEIEGFLDKSNQSNSLKVLAVTE